jgi:hypothetical protein
MSAVSSTVSSILLHALVEERHFALVEKMPYPTKARSQSKFRPGNSVRPMHLFGHNLDHDYYFELLREGGAGCPINYSMFCCTPLPVPSLPACEPNFFTCS